MDMVTLLELRKDEAEGPIAAMPPSLSSLRTGFLPSEGYSNCRQIVQYHWCCVSVGT